MQRVDNLLKWRQHSKYGTYCYDKSQFLDNTTINVVARDGETFTLKTYFPFAEYEQQAAANFLADSFEKNFSKDKSSMVYFVFCDAQANAGFSFLTLEVTEVNKETYWCKNSSIA